MEIHTGIQNANRIIKYKNIQGMLEKYSFNKIQLRTLIQSKEM